jgi:cyanophycinase
MAPGKGKPRTGARSTTEDSALCDARAVNVFLIGGGRDPDGIVASHAPFVAACNSGPIACLILEAGDADRFAGQLRDAGASEVVTSVIEEVSPSVLDGVAGVYVSGGWTPGYADALAGWGEAIRASGVPYAGYSAGAAVAARDALVGGWRLGGREVCAEEAGEDLDELDVRPGLGLIDFAVDVHASQWGTVTRLLAAVDSGLVPTGVAVDEHTCLQVAGDDWTVHGAGAVYRVSAGVFEILRN